MPEKEIRFVTKNGEIKSLPATEMLRKLGVGSVIRIPRAEYPYTAQAGQKFWHINLPIHDGKLGEWVLLAEIIKNGHRAIGQEQVPLLSFEHAFLAKTIFYLDEAPQTLFHQNWAHSAIGFSSPADIPTLIQKRYGLVRGINQDDAQTTPIAIRRFKIRQFLGVGALDVL